MPIAMPIASTLHPPRRRAAGGLAGMVASIAMAALMVCSSHAAAVAKPAAARAPLENFHIEQYQGQPIDLATYRGSVILVNFWATWCHPCVAEFPSLLALKAHFADQPFEILAINMGEDDAAINGFLQRFGGLNFPLLVDRRRPSVAEIWPVRGLPTSIIVDKSGNLAFKESGGRLWSSAESRALIEPLLRE